jgi:hypothetical protein
VMQAQECKDVNKFCMAATVDDNRKTMVVGNSLKLRRDDTGEFAGSDELKPRPQIQVLPRIRSSESRSTVLSSQLAGGSSMHSPVCTDSKPDPT